MTSVLDTQPLPETNGQAETLARIDLQTAFSVVVPTFREAENIPHLLDRLDALRTSTGTDIEVLLMDDNSNDGSVEAVEASGYPWARCVVRTEDPGLSQSVVDGMR